MDVSTIHRKKDKPKHLKTRSVSFRLPEIELEELETEAMQKGISLNVFVKQIFDKYLQWDRFGDKIGMIPVPRSILKNLGTEMKGDDINTIIDIIRPIIKENVMFMKSKYNLKTCIETLEDYMRSSGMCSDHRVEGPLHHFIIQHELGMNWSLFTEQLLKEIFHEFLPQQNVKCQTTETTMIATISLGADFDEHEH